MNNNRNPLNQLETEKLAHKYDGITGDIQISMSYPIQVHNCEALYRGRFCLLTSTYCNRTSKEGCPHRDKYLRLQKFRRDQEETRDSCL